MQKALASDRFISLRGEEDVAMRFGTKVELFSCAEAAALESVKLSGQPQQATTQGSQGENSLQEEENRKTYTALLQNQVLGIQDPQLLNEIHNVDECAFKAKQAALLAAKSRTGCDAGAFSQGSEDVALGTFTSKFPVLSFSSPFQTLPCKSQGLGSSCSQASLFSTSQSMGFKAAGLGSSVAA